MQETYAQIRRDAKTSKKRGKKHTSMAAAVALAVLLISGTTVGAAYISAHTDLLGNVFGQQSRTTKEAYDTVVDNGKGGTTVTMPSREYVAVDEAQAEKLVEPYVEDLNITRKIGDYTLTIINNISDGNAGVLSLKLENPNGRPDIVDAFGATEALMCGLDLRISTRKLADGPVKIRVYVKHDGVFYTDNQSTKGEYHHRFGKRGRLNVAFLGGMVPQKGSLMARELIPMDKGGINWFVLGAIGDKNILEISQENCFFSSTYKKEELPQLLEDNEIDIICILPIWPETFSYTVSEAWLNGIPIVATDIGAVGERIRKTGGGWLVKPDASPDEVMQLLHHIIDHPEEYQAKKEIVDDMEMKTVEQMCEEYRSFYRELLEFTEKELPEDKIDRDFIFQGLALGDPSIGGSGSIAAMNRLKNENAALKASIEVTKGTISYKMARKISDAKIPFKEQMKRFFHRK